MKMKFVIPVGNISEKEARQKISEIMNSYKEEVNIEMPENVTYTIINSESIFVFLPGQKEGIFLNLEEKKEDGINCLSLYSHDNTVSLELTSPPVGLLSKITEEDHRNTILELLINKWIRPVDMPIRKWLSSHRV